MAKAIVKFKIWAEKKLVLAIFSSRN
jgi:hypothetical protein